LELVSVVDHVLVPSVVLLSVLAEVLLVAVIFDGGREERV